MHSALCQLETLLRTFQANYILWDLCQFLADKNSPQPARFVSNSMMSQHDQSAWWGTLAKSTVLRISTTQRFELVTVGSDTYFVLEHSTGDTELKFFKALQGLFTPNWKFTYSPPCQWVLWWHFPQIHTSVPEIHSFFCGFPDVSVCVSWTCIMLRAKNRSMVD